MSDDLSIDILDGGLGILPATGDEVHAVIGVSSLHGTTPGTVVATRSIDNLVAARGVGPAVEGAAVALQQTGKTVLFADTPATNAGTKSAVDSTGASGTSVVTATGAPLDTFDVRFVFVKGGTRGTAGATFKYSLDGGETFSPELALGTAILYAIPGTGLTLNFAAGTFLAGDVHKLTTVEPTWAAADVVTCIRALAALPLRFRLIHLVGALSAADAVTIAPELASLQAKFRFTGLLAHARDFQVGDTDEAGWIAALTTDYAGFADPRVSVTAGHYQIPSPISGRRYRRPLSFVGCARMMNRAIQEHAGRVKTGSLVGITSNANDGKIYHDEFKTPGLDDARFFTARTRIGKTGWFVKSPRMMAQPGSDFQIWPFRSVMDKASDILYDVLVNELDDDLELDPDTGLITEREAQAIEARLTSEYRDNLIATKNASAVTAQIDRTVNILSTKTLKAKVRVVPKGYTEAIQAEIGYTNPALSASGA